MVRNPQQPSGESCLFNLVPWIIISLVLVSVVVAVVASTWALPGEVLYPLKRLTEDTRLNLTRVPSQRIELEEDFDQERLEEIEILREISRSELVDFSAGLSEAKPESEWLVGNIRVLVTPETQIVGQVNLGTYVTVLGTLQSEGYIIAQRIEPREFVFRDRLHSIVSNQWLVDGVTISIAPETAIHGTPAIGSTVEVRAVKLLDEQLIARSIEEIQP